MSEVRYVDPPGAIRAAMAIVTACAARQDDVMTQVDCDRVVEAELADFPDPRVLVSGLGELGAILATYASSAAAMSVEEFLQTVGRDMRAL